MTTAAINVSTNKLDQHNCFLSVDRHLQHKGHPFHDTLLCFKMSRSHSKVYLESLLHPPHSSGAIGSRPASLHRSPSSKNLSTPVANAIDSYKPARSSALASSESAEENDTEDVDDVESEPKPSIDRHLSPSKAASVISSEDDDLDVSSHLRISTLHQSFRRSSDAGSQQQEAVRFILSLLDDHQVDEEVRIENVRNTLAEKLKEFEGNEIVSRIDISKTHLILMTGSLPHVSTTSSCRCYIDTEKM